MKLEMLSELNENAEELTEEVKKATIRNELGDFLIQLNKFHGKLSAAKPDFIAPTSLEDALYKLTKELDKAIGEN